MPEDQRPIRRAAQCSGPTCRALVMWKYTPAGARMPLDWEPTLESGQGVYVLKGANECELYLPMLHSPDLLRYMNHWTTCSDRGTFKAKRP